MMMTDDALTPEMQALVDAGEDVSLHSLTNVAHWTPGWHVLALVRRGLWREKATVRHSDGYSTITYGPA